MLTPAANVSWARCGDGAIAVLDLRNGTWRMFEGPAARVWNAIVLHGSADALADELAEPAGADLATMRTEVSSYVDHLRGTGLLSEPGRTPRSQRKRRWRR